MADRAVQRPAPGAFASPATEALRAGWRDGLAIVNLRGDAASVRFTESVRAALDMGLPVVANTTSFVEPRRIVWAGPDDWFVIGPAGTQQALVAGLRGSLVGQHAAVTDVSSGYTVLSLAGAPARDVLAQGCPLDLHPRVFAPGQSACTHWFKASVTLWPSEAEPGFELLVRRSFMGYAWQMLERTTVECGLSTARFD